MGLESTVNAILDNEDMRLISSIRWNQGLCVTDEKTGKHICKILNISRKVGHASYDRITKKIKFEIYKGAYDASGRSRDLGRNK